MEALGLNLAWFLFQLGNFLLLLAGLTYLLHKPILKLLDERKDMVKESVETAERLKRDAVEAESRQEKLLEEARKQTLTMLDEARIQSKDLQERLSAEAQAKADRLLEKASQEIEEEKQQMHEALRGELGGIVTEATKKILADKAKL